MFDYIKRLSVFEKVVANKQLEENTKVIRILNVIMPNTGYSLTHKSVFRKRILVASYSASNFTTCRLINIENCVVL